MRIFLKKSIIKVRQNTWWGCKMIIRNCAGGVVFFEGNVLIIRNDKGEWTLPKGVIREGELAVDVAKKRVKHETGVDAKIISPIGETSYEFYSYSRQQPVCNQIKWFTMEAESDVVNINKDEGFTDGGFFPLEEAIAKVTYSQEKALINISYNKMFNEKAVNE